MTKKEFIGHCYCSTRFSTLLLMIENDPLHEVITLRQYHNEYKRNFKYQELEEAFVKRIGI